MGWDPNFRMSQVDQGPSMTQILNQGAGGMLGKQVDRMTAQEDKTKAEAERAAQRAVEKERFDKGYLLQQAANTRADAAEGRAVADDSMKRNTREAYSVADTLLGAPGMTQAQAANVNTNKILQSAQAQGRVLTPQEESAIAGQANKAVASNKGLLGQRQLLMEQAPVKELYTPQADGSVLTRKDIDPTAQIQLKEARIGDIDKKLADQARMDQEWKLLGAKQAFERGENDKTRAAAKEKSQPYAPMEVSYFLDKNGGISKTPTDRVVKTTVKSADQLATLNASTGGSMIMGAYTDNTPDGSKASKSAFSGPMLTQLTERFGANDATQILNFAQLAKKANPGLSADDAVGFATAEATRGLTDNVTVEGMNKQLGAAGYKGKLLRR